MPYVIQQEAGKFCVRKKGSAKVVGCHPTKAKAQAQVAAILASEGARGSGPSGTIEVPALMMARAEFLPGTARTEEAGTMTIGLRVYAGAKVRRRAYVLGDYIEFDESLSFEPGAHRNERLLSGRVPLLDNHDDFGSVGEVVLGKVFDPVWNSGAKTLDVQCRVSSREDLEGLRRDLADGIVANVSARYTVYTFRDVTQAGDQVRQLEAVDWETKEVSLVPVGADAGAGTRSEPRPATVTVNVQQRNDMDPETEVEGGQAAATTTVPTPPAQRQGAAQAPPVDAARGSASSVTATEPAPADLARRERERQGAIRTRLARASLPLDDDFARSLFDADVAPDQASSRILDLMATRSEASPSRNQVVGVGEEQGDKLARMLEAAVLERAGKSDLISPEDPKGARALLSGNPFRGRSLMEAGERFLVRANGISPAAFDRVTDPMRRAGEILRPRLQDDYLRGAPGLHETTDFPGILANITTKTLRRAFDLARDTYSQWTTRGSLNDFRQAKRVQIGPAPRLLKKIEGAEYQYGTWGEQSEPIILATYARIVAMTREMMVNDDLDAFMRLPRSYGMSARQLIADLVYAHLTGNTVMADGLALFQAATHKNLITAAGNAFTGANAVVAISNTRVQAREQTAIPPGNGETAFFASLDLVHLRVPEQLETIAQQVIAPIQAQQVSNVNPFQSVFQSVMAEPRLGAASAAAFYLMADPNIIDTIEVSFLSGEDGPVVDSRVGWERDGVEFRVRMDVGTSPIDYRGMYKNNGAT